MRKKEFEIYYSLGLTKKHIIRMVQGEIFLIFLISFFVSTILSNILFQLFLTEADFVLNGDVIGSAFLILLLCVLVCTLVPFAKLRRKKFILNGGENECD